MTCLAKSTPQKAASRRSRTKSIQKLPGSSKAARHRRNFAGCFACRIRGKLCDKQRFDDADGFPTCRWCDEHGVPCPGGFGVKKVLGMDNRWRNLFRIRVKLYMKETGQASGIKGWKRSGPLRETRLSRTEVSGYIYSHRHLDAEEDEHHYDCIYFVDGVCPLAVAQPLGVFTPDSPTSSTEYGTEGGSPSPPFPDTPDVPTTVLAPSEAPYIEPALANELSAPSHQEDTAYISHSSLIMEADPLDADQGFFGSLEPQKLKDQGFLVECTEGLFDGYA